MAEEWITTTEAAARLGVKKATLYSYVSRGQLRSKRGPGRSESLFSADEVNALADHNDPGKTQRTMRFRSIRSQVSSQQSGQLRYRGLDVSELAVTQPVAHTAAQLLNTPATPATGITLPTLRPATHTATLPPIRRVLLALTYAAADPNWQVASTDPETIAHYAQNLVSQLLGVASPEPASLSSTGGTADWVAQLLGARTVTDPQRVLLNAALTVMLDHGLTVSTVAARAAASGRADWVDCLVAGGSAALGACHGKCVLEAAALLAAVTSGVDPAALVHGRAQRTDFVPGFGHFLYADGDPRADLLLDLAAQVPHAANALTAVARLAAQLPGESWKPNVDAALAVVLAGLQLPPELGPVLFIVPRLVGMTAHIVEEYGAEPLRWRASAVATPQ